MLRSLAPAELPGFNESYMPGGKYRPTRFSQIFLYDVEGWPEDVLLIKDSLLDPPAHTGFPAKGLGSCRDSNSSQGCNLRVCVCLHPHNTTTVSRFKNAHANENHNY